MIPGGSKKVEEKFGYYRKKYYICSVRKKLSLINKKSSYETFLQCKSK